MAAVACGAPSSEPEVPVPSAAEVTAAHARHVMERVEREIDCQVSPERHLCAFLALPGEPFDLPSVQSTWLGLHFAVRRSRTLEGGLAETGRVARLTLTSEGMQLLRLDQTSSRARFGLARVRAATRAAANGELPTLEIPEILDEELGYPLAEPLWSMIRQEEGGWTYDNGERVGRLWRVPAVDGRPSALVVLEPVRDGEAGALAAVFPDVLWEVPVVEENPDLLEVGEHPALREVREGP